MQEPSDNELLAEYLKNSSEEAFGTLVSRHVNKVYSVALRHVGNPHQAEEITQAVFVILLKKARTLHKETVLSGWLYHTARLTASTFLRSEIRRVRREQEAQMETLLNQSEENAWPNRRLRWKPC
jgi:RNA polymerase sigma factor (sigma-70 family)